jgi:hypothetical protein
VTRQPSGEELARLERKIARVRLGAVAGAVVAFGAVASLVLVAALLVPERRIAESGSYLPLFLAGLLLCAAALAGAAVGRIARRYRFLELAPELEMGAGLQPGELRGAIELVSPGPGESAELAARHRALIAEALSGRPIRMLARRSHRRARAVRWIGGSLAAAGTIAAAGLARDAPGRTVVSLGALVQPWQVAFPPPASPLRLVAESEEVARGASVAVRVVAPRRGTVRLVWQSAGEAVRAVDLPVDQSTGVARSEIGPVQAVTALWAEDASGEVSDTSTVRPLDPLLLTDLRMEVRYPSHLSRPAELLDRPPSALTLPVGSSLRFAGQTNYPLAAASLIEEDGQGSVPLRTAGRRFAGELVPERSMILEWHLLASDDVPGVRPPPDLELKLVQDTPPEIAIVYPGADTILASEPVLQLVLDVRDDAGIAEVELVSWRSSATGAKATPVLSSLVATGSSGARLVLRPVLDLRGRAMLPGDTLVYFATARDTDPRNPAVSSDTFRARLPSLVELKAMAADRSERLALDMSSISEQAARLAQTSHRAERRMASRRQGGPSAASPGTEQRSGDFGATGDGRQVLDRGEELARRIQEVGLELERLERDLQSSLLSDPSLQRQLRDTELGERLGALTEALRDLDNDALRESVAGLSADLGHFQRQLERSAALMKRVALEQSLGRAAERAAELARQQELAAEGGDVGEAWARREDRLALRAEELDGQVEMLGRRLEDIGLARAAGEARTAARRLSEAAGRMRSAAGNARTAQEGNEERRGGAAAGSREAGEWLWQAAEVLRAARETLAADGKAEALEAVDRAVREALDLALEQGRITREMKGSEVTSEELAGRQAALRRGLGNLLQSLSEAGRKTALLDGRVGPAAAGVATGMEAMADALADGKAGDRGTARNGEQLTESLNELAGRLIASRKAVQTARSATGMEEALEQLARAGRAQAGLNDQAASMFLLLRGGRHMAESLHRLAREQAEIAAALDSAGGRWRELELPGRPAVLATAAEEIARRLATGTLDRETLARQEQLFRRLLDAGRTLEREDPGNRRESFSASQQPPEELPEVEPVSLSGPRYPYPDAEALRGVEHGYRGLILEYFDRLNRQAEIPDQAAGGAER